jgi:hypothetical protein
MINCPSLLPARHIDKLIALGVRRHIQSILRTLTVPLPLLFPCALLCCTCASSTAMSTFLHLVQKGARFDRKRYGAEMKPFDRPDKKARGADSDGDDPSADAVPFAAGRSAVAREAAVAEELDFFHNRLDTSTDAQPSAATAAKAHKQLSKQQKAKTKPPAAAAAAAAAPAPKRRSAANGRTDSKSRAAANGDGDGDGDGDAPMGSAVEPAADEEDAGGVTVFSESKTREERKQAAAARARAERDRAGTDAVDEHRQRQDAV